MKHLLVGLLGFVVLVAFALFVFYTVGYTEYGGNTLPFLHPSAQTFWIDGVMRGYVTVTLLTATLFIAIDVCDTVYTPIINLGEQICEFFQKRKYLTIRSTEESFIERQINEIGANYDANRISEG